MELHALYDLQERLEAAAAAGVRLAGEDFRLKRAVDSIAPLADASPVIKKLYLMASQTIAPDCKDRAGTCSIRWHSPKPFSARRPGAAFPARSFLWSWPCGHSPPASPSVQ